MFGFYAVTAIALSIVVKEGARREMTADEKEVRDAWEHVEMWVRDLDSYGTDQAIVALFFTKKDARVRMDAFQLWQEDDTSKGRRKLWSASAAFTRERKEQIRKVEEEIAWIKTMIETGTYIFGNEKRVERILARETEALNNLRRGMKDAVMQESIAVSKRPWQS